MAQQTAVEWLIMQLPVKIRVELYEKNIQVQALKMEKEQNIGFAKHCLDKALDLDIRTAFFNAEQDYNETYNK